MHAGVERTRVEAREVKARWGYAEAGSSRWGGHYREILPELARLSAQGVPFEALPDGSDELLIEAVYHVRAREFVVCIDTSPTYRLESLTRAELRQLLVLESCLVDSTGYPGTFGEYVDLPGWTEPDGSPVPHDPRNAFKLVHPVDSRQKHGGIVINWGGRPMFIEGYLRAMLFLNYAPPATTYRAWWPDELPRLGGV